MQEELYWKMYARLCAEISNAIDLLKKPENSLYVSSLLQKALLDAEEMYLSAEIVGQETEGQQINYFCKRVFCT